MSLSGGPLSSQCTNIHEYSKDKEAQGIGDSRTELICMALFHSFKLVVLCGTAAQDGQIQQ